jgi:hypothetical protein
MADFFKDMKHAEHEIDHAPEAKKSQKTGEAFVHASKYLSRLLDAAQLLSEKYKDQEFRFALVADVGSRFGEVTSPGTLAKRVDGLLYGMRKSSAIPAELKGDVGYDEASKVFGVRTIAEFRKKISDFGVELNQKVRALEDFRAAQTVDKATERRSFGVHDAPPEMTAAIEDMKLRTKAAKALVAKKVPAEARGKAMLKEGLLATKANLIKTKTKLATFVGGSEIAQAHQQDALAAIAEADAVMVQVVEMLELVP